MEKRTIGQNIIHYRKRKDISQKELAKLIGMSPQNLLRIEKDIVNPTAETLQKIMNALCITPNQLFGAEQYENVHIQIPFARNIKGLRESRNLSTEEMAKLLEVPEKDVLDMEKGTLLPSTNLLKKICNELDVTQDYLTENNIYQRNENEVKILEKIKKRNNIINNARDIEKYADPIDHGYTKDPTTGDIFPTYISSIDQAKGYLIEELEKLSFHELLKIFKISLDREISRLSDELNI